MRVVINVTQADIRKGVPQSPSGCPIAGAVRRTLAIPQDEKLFVFPPSTDMGEWAVSLPTATGTQDVRLPRKAANRALRYDETGKMQPFDFTLSLPSNRAASCS
jgi:hypothetical protein